MPRRTASEPRKGPFRRLFGTFAARATGQQDGRTRGICHLWLLSASFWTLNTLSAMNNVSHVQKAGAEYSSQPAMKLLEYQAKEVLASLGIPIPPGKVARTPEEAAAACAELGPVAVKAQVPVGGRGKAGGIKLAKTPDEARIAAEQIIGMDIKGFKVPLVYCEAALEIEREIYLGFTVDRDARANILMLSARGGMDIEQVADESPASIARLYPNPWRGPLDFELTQLVFDAGLGDLARQLTGLI